MSAPEKLDQRARLLTYARWAAIGLASLSALMIAVFSGTGALRVAAFFAVVAVVLVILSITLNGAASQKAHLEETLLEEIDMLREDVRADITTAARATHRAFAERVAHLHQNVEHLRREYDSRALGEAPPQGQMPLGPMPGRRALPGPPGPVVHTETVHVTTHYVDQPDEAYLPRPAPRPRPEPRPDRYPPRPPEREPAPGPANWRGGAPARSDDRGRGAWAQDDRGREGRPGEEWGRDTRARDDRARDDRARDDRRDARGHDDWGREHRGQDERDDPRPYSPPIAPEESWSPPRPSESHGSAQPRRSYVTPMSFDDDAEVAAWRSRRDPGRDDDPADDPQWSGMRAGDRWAEVRTDERGGRELRMGERRTAIHTDETGTQMRIVDRWSSVRQEPAYPSSGYPGDSLGGHSGETPGFSGEGRSTETRSERRRREEAEESERRAESEWRSGRSAGADRSDRADRSDLSDRGDRSGGGDRFDRGDRSRPALPASGPEPAAAWIRGDERAERVERVERADGWSQGRPGDADVRSADRRPSPRARHEISGEIVRDRPSGDQRPPSRGGYGQLGAYDDRGDPHESHSRDDDRVQERGRARDSGRSRDEGRSRDDGRGHGDNRWERESSGGRSGVRHSFDFDHTDERWH